MVLHHILDSPISPVLILLEIGHEARPSNSGEPPCRNTLHSSSQQQSGEIHAQSGSDQGDATLHHAKTGQRPTDGDLSLIHI